MVMMVGAQRQRKQQDPAAHHVSAPGKRLLQRIPLHFVWHKVTGKGGKEVNASLALVPFIDFLLVTVIFLLMSFSASGNYHMDRHITLPAAKNVEGVVEAPMVAVNGNQVMVDGELAGSTRAIEDQGVMRRVDLLFDLLRRKRELWKSFHPDKPFPGVCLLQIDENVPALVVKSVFQTAALAGFPNVSFMVRRAKTPSD
jgi:biopolymer transport protein ExbD